MCVSICVQYIICGNVLEIEYVKCDFTLGILVSFQRKRWEQKEGGMDGIWTIVPKVHRDFGSNSFCGWYWGGC